MIDLTKKNTGAKNKGAYTMINNKDLSGVIQNKAKTNEDKEEMVMSMVQKADNNKVTLKKKRENIALMTTEGLIDPLDGDMVEDGYLSPLQAC